MPLRGRREDIVFRPGQHREERAGQDRVPGPRPGDTFVLSVNETNPEDYVRKFAQQARRGLDPSLRVYVENSNEVWNGMFKQQRHAGDTGIKLGLREKHWEAGWLYYSQRSVEMFKVWEEVLGGTDRLVRILALQRHIGEPVTTLF